MAYDFLKLPGEQMVPRAASSAGVAATGPGKVSWVVVGLIIVGLAVAYYLFGPSKPGPRTEKTPAQGVAPWRHTQL